MLGDLNSHRISLITLRPLCWRGQHRLFGWQPRKVPANGQVAQWWTICLSKQETQEMQVRSLGRENPLEEGVTTHSSILTWEISWTEEPGRLEAMGLQRVGHYSATEHMHTQSSLRGKNWSLKLLQICFLSTNSFHLRAWAECQQKQWKLQMCSFHSVYFSLLKHVELGKEGWDL